MQTTGEMTNGGAGRQFVAPTAGDRCANCDAPLVSDQRYCLECGARRAKTAPPPPPPVAAEPPPPPPEPPRKRASSGAVLVGGVATLVLAMGVGVLIGHNGNAKTQPAAATPQVITVNGGGAGSTASAPGGAVRHAAARKAKAKAKGKKGGNTTVTRVVHISQKTKQAAAGSAARVLGGSAPKNPTVQPGQSCTGSTQGCQGGHFTGNFFGGN